MPVEASIVDSLSVEASTVRTPPVEVSIVWSLSVEASIVWSLPVRASIGQFQKISIHHDGRLFGIPRARGGSLNWNSEGMGGYLHLEF